MPDPCRGLIGVIHLPPMPGDPRHQTLDGGFAEVEQHALRDAEALARGGVDGLIVENFGSAPFPRGDRQQPAPPQHVALMALVARRCREQLGLPLGINCLRNDALAALGIAAATGAQFIRVNVHTGAYVTDQGLIQGEAYTTLRSRRALGVEPQVAILADVLVKHAAPLAPLSPEAATADTVERGLADGVIVTGAATGDALERRQLERVLTAAGACPVYVGSGLSPELSAELCPLVDGAIVGTWVKEGGKVYAPVDTERVGTLVRACAGRWRQR